MATVIISGMMALATLHTTRQRRDDAGRTRLAGQKFRIEGRKQGSPSQPFDPD
ncbi:hypothetical protein GAO09_09230 [Rhizobiales bacterium RZME27]|uniref:Uncharacterized protein n=1 Tax=Endobacterium cereale TaxID=2663029 RepID=A0A6A8A9B8_9HYPH|nr:hypothetical protein [Endobacterium cereale]MEB2843987.1 hypothetical protein [Endobacterium cereale]MQY46230.1 hypothetical protein [Endobacterium cereale]